MLPVDPVIAKLRSEGLCHPNELTGCEIWVGDLDRKGRPQFGHVRARDYMYQAASGEVIRRGEDVRTSCENPLCILPAHLEKVEAEKKMSVDLPEDDIRDVEEEYFLHGNRIDVIADAHNWSKPYTTKLVAAARLRRGVASE